MIERRRILFSALNVIIRSVMFACEEILEIRLSYEDQHPGGVYIWQKRLVKYEAS